MNCRKFCDFFNQWKGFLYGDTKLAFLAGNVYLDQDRDFAVVLYRFLTDRFCQTKRIDRMNQGNFSCNVFYFIPLQMTDHVPVDILWQHFLFFCQLLHFVFTEIAFAKICLLYTSLLSSAAESAVSRHGARHGYRRRGLRRADLRKVDGQ